MSSPILPISGPLGQASIPTPATDAADGFAAFARELGTGHDGFAIDATRGEPPPELLGQMREAQEIAAHLRERGLEMRFSPGRDGGAPTIELHDSESRTVRRLTTAEAMAIATGEAAE